MTPRSDFQPPEPPAHKLLWFQPPAWCGSLLRQPQQTNTESQCARVTKLKTLGEGVHCCVSVTFLYLSNIFQVCTLKKITHI